jgi:hypothetical protein
MQVCVYFGSAYMRDKVQCVCSRRCIVLFMYITNTGFSFYLTTVVTSHRACGQSAEWVTLIQ